jgi:hypothetical protein
LRDDARKKLVVLSQEHRERSFGAAVEGKDHGVL